jgi:undecaprenyl diphosphate synthase
MEALGVRVRWAGRRPRLWSNVIRRLEAAEERTRDNDRLTLAMCVNYGGRAELADAAAAIARDVRDGRLRPDRINEQTVARYLDEPEMPDVDLLIRTSGEQRLSNFLLWQAAYAEFSFVDTLWPDFDRRDLWAACEDFARRDRRYGGIVANHA